MSQNVALRGNSTVEAMFLTCSGLQKKKARGFLALLNQSELRIKTKLASSTKTVPHSFITNDPLSHYAKRSEESALRGP